MVLESAEGVNRGLVAQVAEVGRPLLSVSKTVKADNTVVFSKKESKF